MPSTYSPLLRLELIGAGEQSGLWGDTTNKNLGQLIEQAVAGVTTVSLSGGAGDYTLTALDGTYDEARSAVLKFIGNPSGQKNIVIPTETKLYVVRNDCGQTITVKTAAQPTGVTLLNGEASLVFCDGTNAVAGIATAGVGATTVANGGTGATSFTAGFIKSPGGTGVLTSSATVSLTSEVSGIAPPGNGGTGRSSLTAGRILVGDGVNPVGLLGGSVVGQVATWDGTQWVAQTPSTGGNVSSVFGRTGAITALSTDYSSFYAPLNGVGTSGTWPINISGSAGSVSSVSWSVVTGKPNTLSGYGINDAISTSGSYSNPSWIASLDGSKISGTVSNSSNLGNVAASSYARRNADNSFTGLCTFVNGGIRSPAYNLTTYTSMFGNTSSITWSVSGSSVNNVMSLTSSGNLSIAGTLSQGSDPRLKEDIVDYARGLETLSNIRVRSWVYNGKGGTIKGRKAVGVVATEIEQYMPEMIIEFDGKLNPTDTDTTKIKQVDALQMTWLLVKSVQELKAEVDSLKAQLAAK